MHTRAEAASRGASAQHDPQSPWSVTSSIAPAHIGHASAALKSLRSSDADRDRNALDSLHPDGKSVPARRSADAKMIHATQR
jgi:hypothetical protein